MIDDATLDEAVRRLKEAAPQARVVLFGSHAAGKSSPHSDLDLLIVEPEVEHEGEESIRLRRALRGLGIAADVIVVSEEYVNEWRDVRGSLVHAALSEGRVLVG